MGFGGIFFIVSLTISTVGGLKCFSCTSGNLLSCLNIVECPSMADRCYTSSGETLNKGCQSSTVCAVGGALDGALGGAFGGALGGVGSCCEGDLCNFTNASNSVGSSFILLLLSTAALYFL